jgi:beta-lactamase regulating signal transducer with metallopeptidase domain/polyhydroxyalkanoate synthesis regulator phasin
MTLREFMNIPEWSALGAAVLQFLWQGAVIGVLAAAGLHLLRHRSSASRYVVACGAMVLCLATFVATFFIVLPSGDPGVMAAATSAAPAGGVLLPDTAPPAHRDIAAWCWVLGFLAMALRYLRHWMWARRLKFRQVSAPDSRWQETFRALRAEFGVSPSVTMLRSTLAETAMVVGWIKPVVLVPACAFTSLTPQQLQAVLAHELMHIRRHDQWVNLVQGVIEVILFFHPATWWLSRRINTEREYCCDDASVRTTGCPQSLAEALTRLESLRLSSPANGLAATGGSLMDRITRILGDGAGPTNTNPKPNKKMNKTIGTIGAVTVLIGSLFIAQADEHRGGGLSKDEFERAAAVLKKGVAEGQISEDAARAGIEGMRAAMAKPAQAGERSRPAEQGDPGNAARRLRQAVADGTMTKEEAQRKMEALRRDAGPGRDNPERKAGAGRNPREAFARAQAELKKAVESGRITEQQAKERLEAMRKRQAAQGREGGGRNPREAFAKAEAEIRKAVEDGKITPEQARERLQAMRQRMAAARGGERNPREALTKAEAEIRKAVEDGKITPEQARERLQEMRQRMAAAPGGERNPREAFARAETELKKAVESGRITEEQARERLQEMRRQMAKRAQRNVREEYARAEDAMEKMVEEGKITEEQAKQRLEEMRKRMQQQQERGNRERDERGDRERREKERERGEREEGGRNVSEVISERIKTAGGRLKAAVQSGEMTPDEAWANWEELKKTHIGPRLEEAVKTGGMTEEDAKVVWRSIEKAELGEKLKAAVAAGEMSEEDAKAKWEAFEKGDNK